MHKLTRVALFVTGALLASQQVSAQVTSSSIRGQLLDASGSPLGGVTVEVIHVPTGTKKTITTSENGIFHSRGMTVGGPYVVKLMDGSQHQVRNIEDLFLKLGKTESITLQVQAPQPVQSNDYEVISVQGSASMLSAMKKGPSAEFSEADIANTASISRDLKSLLKKDSKIMVDPTADGGPALSVAGGNVRGNSLTVDGVKQNDDFGLNKNGYPGRRSPISLDAIEQISVNIAPYDVTYGDFQGGNINVVTKSGTNEFEGSVYYYRSDDGMIGDKSESQDQNIGEFSEDTYGFTFGGPIIEDKLFFFASYEKFEATSPYQFTLDNLNGVIEPNERIGVTQADYDLIAQVARDTWGYDIGQYDKAKDEQSENLLLKLDWYITDDHRMSLTYQDNEGNTVRDYWAETFPNARTATSESNRYNQNETLEAYSLQFFSDWNEDFSTEIKISNKEVLTNQDPLMGANFGQMTIMTENGGRLYIGPDQFRHANVLGNDRQTVSIKGDYFLTDEHKLTFGWDNEVLDIYNLFVFGSLGFTDFASVSDFENNLGFHVFQNSLDGNPLSAADEFEFTQNTFYIQDEWNATDELTVTYGLRYTRFSNDDLPALNSNFALRHGYTNQFNYDGLDLIQPRLGLTYEMDDDTTLRGGIGLFGGMGPNVWLSNSYGNDGVRKQFAGCFGGCFDGRSTPQEVLDFLAVGGFDGGNGNTNSVHPGFEMPSVWKVSFGVDRRQDFGAFGDDWLISADVIYTKVNEAPIYRELNMTEVDTAPDGRPVYSKPAPFDLSLQNTDKGHGILASVFVEKEIFADSGTYNLSFGYTYQNAKEVNPANSFIAFEGYSMAANVDYQGEDLYNSEFEVPHALAGSFTWSNEVFGDNTTTISIGYTGRTGRHYSHTMRTGVDNGFGGFVDFASWVAFASQSLYVPTDENDPLVTYAPGFDKAGFFNYIDSNDCLARGGISRRHSCESSWIHIFDVRFMQEVRFNDDQVLEFTLDIENVGNMINNDWGRVEGYVQPFNAPVVTASFAENGVDANGNATYDYSKYVYSDFTLPVPNVAKVPSVWKIQLGVRFRF